MTAPLFLVPEGSLDGLTTGDRVPLTGPEAHHAATVTRVGVGEQVLLGDGHGAGVEGIARRVERDEVLIEVAARRDEPVRSLRFVLVQALTKGGRDEDAVEAATELGVDGIIPWQADRSIVRWRGEKADRALAKWRSVVQAAAKQARRVSVPTVEPMHTTAQVAAMLAEAGDSVVGLILHEDATTRLTAIDLPQSGTVVVMVGPEGGISTEELDSLQAAGAQPVKLGDTVLRAGTAGPAALAVLSARSRWS